MRQARLPAVHDTARQEWRHLDFFQHQAFLHARTPRITSSDCGIAVQVSQRSREGSPQAREGCA
ncbi:MAG: transposase family protein [Hyphomicrobiaceae bacterium]